MKTFLTLLSSLLFCSFVFSQNALNFDGVNDQVQTTFPGILGTANRTFEAWINVSSTPNTNIAIMDYGVNQVGSRNTFVVNPNLGITYISGGTNANLGSPTSLIPIGQWVHVAFVLNNGTGFLYVNGSQVATGNLSTVNTPSGNENLKMGQRVAGGSIPFNGSIDELRIWNVARTASEISNYRNVEFCSNPTGLVAYYKLNEGVAGGTNTAITTTADEVSGNNGTLSSFALTGSSSNFITGVALSTSFASTQTLTGCPGYSITVGTNTYDSTGIFSDTLISTSTGCDSVVTTDLTINSSDSSSQTLIGCPGFSVSVGTNTYTSTGIFVDTLTSAITGCDSIVTTNLTISNVDSTTQTLNECPGFSVSVGANTYTSSGVYTDTLTSMVTGCDSIVTTDLTIATVDVSTSVADSTITANLSGATYFWIDCDNGNAVIPGETSQSFTPMQNGNYAVIVLDGNCSDTSACVPIIVVGIDLREVNSLSVFPNPAKESITIQLNKAAPFSVRILNSVGQQIGIISGSQASTRIDVSNYPSGLYFLEIKSEGKTLRRKFTKPD